MRNETDKINSDCLFGLISGFRIMVHFCLGKNFRPARCEYSNLFSICFILFLLIYFFAQYLLASNSSLNLAILLFFLLDPHPLARTVCELRTRTPSRALCVGPAGPTPDKMSDRMPHRSQIECQIKCQTECQIKSK